MYNFKGSNQFKERPMYFTLKRNTYLNVLVALIFISIVSVIGHKFVLEQNKTKVFQVKSEAYAKEIKTMKTYKEPTIDAVGQEKASIIIRQIWRKDYLVGMALAGCESGFRESVVNSIGATGYFQILAPVHRVSIKSMQEGYANVGFAYSLYKEQGLTPWVSSRSCWIGRI